MVRAGFGQGSDYSGLFASLYSADIANRERLARDLEQRNKERDAAKDSEVFSKFQHGDLSGAELLSYIRRRIEETSYDPQEQAKWKDALRDYQDSIATQAAEDAYANGGSIRNLIAFYQDKKKGAAQGSPEYSQVTQRLNALVDKAAADDLYLGAQRIQDKIDRGEATLEDLERFLRRQISSMRAGSASRDQALAQLNTVQDNIHTRDLTASVASLDYKLSAGQITAADYNSQMLAIAAPYQSSNPQFYYGLLTKGQNAIDTEQQNAVDPTAFSAWGAPPGAAPSTPGRPPTDDDRNHIPNWSSGANGSDIKYISQFDGSEFAKVNCVYASGAMLAQAMGVTDLSGGDLRWLSGDTRGGSTYSQLNHALRGVGLSADYNQNISFNDFLNKIKSGTPATLGGLSARLPDALHGSYQGKHSIYVDRYDPNKGFLVYDPATRKPRWWSEDILRAFSWGGGGNPNALFAPVGSVSTNRTAPANISIFDQPRRPGTPRNYGVGSTPGVEDHARANLGQTNTPPTPRTNADGAPLPPYGQTIPQTQDEAADDLSIVGAMQDRAINMAAVWEQGNSTYTDGTTLNDAVVQDALNEAYDAAPWRAALASQSDNPAAMQDAFNSSAELGARMLNMGDARQAEIFNGLLSRADAIFAHSDANSADPFQSQVAVRDVVGTLRSFLDKLDPGQPTADEAVTGTYRDQIASFVTAAELASDPDANPTDVAVAIGALPSDQRGIVDGIRGAAQATKGVADGTLAMTVVSDGRMAAALGVTWNGVPGYFAVKARQETLPDGQTINVPDIPNMARSQMAPVAIMVDGKPTVIFVPSNPTPIPGLTQMVVTNAAVVNAELAKIGAPTLAADYTGPLAASLLSLLSASTVARLRVNGFALDEVPVLAPAVVVPSYLSNGVTVPPQTLFQDTGRGTWATASDFVNRATIVPDGYGGVSVNDQTGQADFSYQVYKGFTVIDATGAPVTMQDFVNHGGIDAYDTGVYRDADGNIPTDPSVPVVIPNKSTLYSSVLQMQSWWAREHGDVPVPFGPPAPPRSAAPLPAYAQSQQYLDWRAREQGDVPSKPPVFGPLDMAASLGVNMGVKTPGYTPPGYTPPPPPATAYPGFTVPTSSSPSLPVITLPKPQSSPTVNAQTGFVIPPPVATTPPRYLSNKLLGRAGPQDY